MLFACQHVKNIHVDMQITAPKFKLKFKGPTGHKVRINKIVLANDPIDPKI